MSRLFYKNLSFYLSFFSEIGKSETLGGLVFFLVSYACYDKNDYRYNVRKHFDKRFLRGGDAGNIVAYLVERAENERTENGEIGLPKKMTSAMASQPMASMVYSQLPPRLSMMYPRPPRPAMPLPRIVAI